MNKTMTQLITPPLFAEFPKIARLSRLCIITEKLDGTNAQIFITEDGTMLAGSRNRWITPENDNFGFAAWAQDNREELLKLGPGRHFGEWWGAGIQRGYGLKNTDKRFSLFNTIRWAAPGTEPQPRPNANPTATPVMQEVLPSCVGLVPELYRGEFDTVYVTATLETLKKIGSVASPGFMRPEGLICYHVAANVAFKKTIEKDEEPKGKGR